MQFDKFFLCYKDIRRKAIFNHGDYNRLLLENVQSMRKIAQIFVCFSESPNFMKTPVLAIIYPTVFWLSYSLSDRQIAAAVVPASYTGVLN